jgi:hypothetical protein
VDPIDQLRDQWSPGMAVGGGGALTGGVNRLPPVGLIDFSVGATDEAGGAVVVVLVVVVVVGVVVYRCLLTLPASCERAHGDDRAHACGCGETTSQAA